MNQRDPRIDPRNGDVLRFGKFLREVTGRSMHEVTYTRYSPSARKPHQGCWISTWQDWARKAEVIHRAE